MTYQTRTILRRSLPIVFWLLAVGGCIAVPLAFRLSVPANYWYGFIVGALLLGAILILKKVDRHTPSAEEIFITSILLSIASYWAPTVLFLLLPAWIFLLIRNAFNHKSILATLLGSGFVAIYAAILIYVGWIDFPWADFFSPDYLWAWIPASAMLLAWTASTIARLSLRER